MDTLNEGTADQAVIRSLLATITSLKGTDSMVKYFKDAGDGKLYKAIQFEEVSADEIRVSAEAIKAKAAALDSFLQSIAPAEAAEITPPAPQPAPQPTPDMPPQPPAEQPVPAAVQIPVTDTASVPFIQ